MQFPSNITSEGDMVLNQVSSNSQRRLASPLTRSLPPASSFLQKQVNIGSNTPPSSSGFLPFAPLTSSQDYLLNSPTVTSLAVPKPSSLRSSSNFSSSEIPKVTDTPQSLTEKYLGSIKMEVEQLLDLQIGPGNELSVHKEDSILNILLGNQIVAHIPEKTSNWLSLLLSTGKLRLNVRGSSADLKDNSIYLFIQIFLIVDTFKQNRTMDKEERVAWYELSDAIGKRKPATSIQSAPQMRTSTNIYSSPLSSSSLNSPQNPIILTPNTTLPERANTDSLGSRLVKRSTTEIYMSPRASKYSKNSMEDSISLKSNDSESGYSAGDYMAKQLFENLHKPIGNEMNPSASLICSLRPYQKQALAWLVEREQSGKKAAPITQQTSGSILPENWTECETDCGKKYYYNQLTKTTHWEFPIGDISHKKPKNSVRGGILADEMGMGKTIEMLALILTNTPHLLERLENGDTCLNSQITPSNIPRSTLVVCPLSVLTQWTQEMERHSISNFLSVYVYHGANRNKDPSFLHEHDVVVTTFATLATELPSDKNSKKKKNTNKVKGALLKVNWLRVILDEAHTIKDRTTRTAKAAFELNSQRKWCVTGTPIQNKLDDLFSLLHFLQVEPFCDYNWWNQVIMKPIRSRDDKGFARLQTILQSILLRRTKTQRINNAPIVSLPPRIMKVRKIPFMKEEEDFYKALWDNAKTKFNKYVEIGTVLKNYAHILELLLRLRQACDHPNLVVSSRSRNAKNVHKMIEKYLSSSKDSTGLVDNLPDIINRCNIGDIECLICMETIESPVITPCGHLFCKDCIEREILNSTTTTTTTKNTKCPCCISNISKKSLISIPTTALSKATDVIQQGTSNADSNWTSSSKIEALLQELVTQWKSDPTIKSIVFSQWTSMLNLIESPLKQMGVKFVRLDGSMSQSNREISVKSFNTDENVKIFLISMKAGGLGLNLVSASTVFLLDPWWNPATEQQAIDRVHRLGQRKPVFVTRFIIKGTIEERILELQDKKRRLVQGALGKHSKELRQIRLEELRLLFRD